MRCRQVLRGRTSRCRAHLHFRARGGDSGARAACCVYSLALRANGELRSSRCNGAVSSACLQGWACTCTGWQSCHTSTCSDSHRRSDIRMCLAPRCPTAGVAAWTQPEAGMLHFTGQIVHLKTCSYQPVCRRAESKAHRIQERKLPPARCHPGSEQCSTAEAKSCIQ